MMLTRKVKHIAGTSWKLQGYVRIAYIRKGWVHVTQEHCCH